MIRIKPHSLFLFLSLSLVCACGRDSGADAESGDGDANSDTDTDTVTNTDIDTDTDTDTGTGTDVDTDGGGVLSIIGLKEEDHGASYTSGRINSEFEVPRTPGTRVEARLKLSKKNCGDGDPFVNGAWPAFWMLGSDSTERGYGGSVAWPGCGEIDIIEWIGSYDANHYQTNQWGEPAFTVDHNDHAVVPYGADGPEQWHVYGVRFNDDSITFTFNGEDQATRIYDDGLDHKHRIILNMALGGDMGGTIAADFVNEELQVDWVRVYDENGTILWRDEMDDEAHTKANWFTFVGMAYNNEEQYYTDWEPDNFEWHADMTRGECP